VKAIVEEQVTLTSARPATQEQRAQSAVKAVPMQAQPKPQVVDTPSEENEYRPSCLDLAAEFICRG
jgi:hypothetical protein